ncbi:SDR family oxidoreductase [Pseudomonas corrugata]|uniref:SDR family oxidoreductase n=1 Tax=Pseudomonas corrugata TaxID=47879 RepID=UPI001585EC37|nr:SDR family oxidoreductase [Pseudomonas corrugata]MCI0995630.1 SDR family oxidoreductase [Pseudomonas corrugata]NUT64681.1 SDR family oxidoreductase [Pseudomonas corrugata]
MNDLFAIKGKVALVTGGAQGMGRMIAEGLLRAGAKVYISSRKRDICVAAVEELSHLGSCIGLVAELDTPQAVIDLAAQLKARESCLDILINNAGRTWGAPLDSFPDKAWAPVMAVNVQGPFTLVRELLPLLRAAAMPDDPARVINIGSLAGALAEPIQAYSYAASKAAIHHLSRVLAAELAPEFITVNAIVPGYFPTKMTAHLREEEDLSVELQARIPLQRLGTAEDIVGMCIFLSSRAGAYVTGSELSLDGGMLGCR